MTSIQSPIIAPSILAADFGRMDDEIQMLNESVADWVHCDIMDGRFVPNISFGFPVLEAVGKKSDLLLDVHLMIVSPEQYFDACRKAGAGRVTFHWEASHHVDRAIHQIQELGMKAGIALNPATPVEVLENVLPLLDLVCLMSVNPGFGGQTFILNTLKKIQKLRKMANDLQPDLHIEIDGGINLETGVKVLNAGANVLVAGSFVFKSEYPKQVIRQLKSL